MIHSHMNDTGFQALLSALPNSLSQLDLEDNQISEQSLPALLAFINARSNLRQISLKGNGISNDNAAGINVSDFIEQILKVTNKKHCIFTLDIDEMIKEKMAELTDGRIMFPYGDIRGHHILQLYNEMKKKPDQNWELELSCRKKILPIGYCHLADILSSTLRIVALNLRGNDIDEEEQNILLKGLQNNKTLSTCQLWSTLNNQEMEYIGRFIQNNPALKELDLYECAMGDNGAAHLVKVLPESHLEVLQLSRNSLGDQTFASLLSSIPPTLKELSLSSNKITEASLKTILNFLATNQTLKILEMKYNPIVGNGDPDGYEDTNWQQLKEAAKQHGVCELT